MPQNKIKSTSLEVVKGEKGVSDLLTGKLVTDNLFRAEEATSKVAFSYLDVRKKVANPL